MDSRRFDAIARSVATPATRRSALGALIGSSILGAFGFGRTESARVAAQQEQEQQEEQEDDQGQGGLCVLEFAATVRQGPSASRTLVIGGDPGELRGFMRFSLSRSGDLQNADLLLEDGSSLPVVGQATGHGFQARIDFGQGRALVAVGVGEQEVTRCLGPLDGLATGPAVGDLGEWHALAGVQNIPGGDGGGASTETRERDNRQAAGAAERGNRASARAGERGNRPRGDNTETRGGGNRPAADAAGGSNPPSGGGTTEGSTSDSGSEETCPADQTRCGDDCVDLQTDPLHCGQCGSACADELGASVCIDGVCACSPRTTRCDDVCVNTDLDPLNCGACGTVCADDEECSGGACTPGEETSEESGSGNGSNTETSAEGTGDEETCPTDQTRCGDACVDLQTDASNCGACGVVCPTGETCLGGACTPEVTTQQTAGCPEGQLLCGGQCRNAIPVFESTGIVCAGGGAPPETCPPGMVLCNGACHPEGACQSAECPPGFGYCYGLCRDFLSDPGYCGGCTTGCTGGAFCAGGQCVSCQEPLMPCGAACVDIFTDLNNCGGCGNLCGTLCIEGSCAEVGPAPVFTCPAGQIDCGGACVDPTSDNNNCGQCGTVCSEAQVCRPGGCVNSDAACLRFGSGLSACHTKCADTRTDPEHCGGCFHRCTNPPECINGICAAAPASANVATLVEEEPPAFTCPEGQIDCGGVCIDPSFDPFNCGGCGVICGSDVPCEFGVCGAAPAEGGETVCVATGDACDPASPDACCTGSCNEDGTCA